MESIIFSVDGREELLTEVLSEFTNITLDTISKGIIETQVFSDGECCVKYGTSIRGKRVFL